MVGDRRRDAGPAPIREPIHPDSRRRVRDNSAPPGLRGDGRRLAGGADRGATAAGGTGVTGRGADDRPRCGVRCRHSWRAASTTSHSASRRSPPAAGCCSSSLSTWSVLSATRHGCRPFSSRRVPAAAVLGIVLLAMPAEVTVSLLGQDHTVAGARRLQATFGYPNTAAVAFEAAVFVAVGLLGAFRDRLPRVLIGGAIVVLVLATALTLSRGAVLGLLAGSAMLVVVAWFAGRRRLAALAAAGGSSRCSPSSSSSSSRCPSSGCGPTARATSTAPPTRRPSTSPPPDDHPRDVTVTVTNTGSAAMACRPIPTRLPLAQLGQSRHHRIRSRGGGAWRRACRRQRRRGGHRYSTPGETGSSRLGCPASGRGVVLGAWRAGR